MGAAAPIPPLGVIVNPTAGGGKSLRIPISAPHEISTSEADFRDKVRQYAKQYKTIGICGGDSSLTIAAEELVSVKFKGALQFIPAGSVNDIVLDIQEQATQNTIHLGKVTTAGFTKHFIGQTNWGLGVVVNRWVGAILRYLPFLRALQNSIGALALITAHVLRREIVEAEISADGKLYRGKYSIILVSQIRHWAGGLRFCPQASFATPEFRVVLLPRQNLFKLLKSIQLAKIGALESFAARAVTISFTRDVAAQVDGDISPPSKLFSLTKIKTNFTLES